MKHEEALRQAFGLSLKTLRRRRGFSQEKMALETGISRAHMSDMERGLRYPKLDTLFQICMSLDIPFVVLAREIDRNYERMTAMDDKSG